LDTQAQKITMPDRPTILVSSTVYGIEELLDRIYTVLICA